MSNILQEIESQIAGLKTAVTKSNVGVVREIGDGAAKVEGLSDVMLGWEPPFGVGRETVDPSVRLIPLEEVLAETARLLDGSSPVIKRRMAMLAQVEEILPG